MTEKIPTRKSKEEFDDLSKRIVYVCESNSMVESQPSKLLVAGSIPVFRSSMKSNGLPTNRQPCGNKGPE